MNTKTEVSKALRACATAERAKANAWFFKTGPGEYGEGDKFLGVTVPDQRKIAKKFYKSLSPDVVEAMLHSPWHEERLTALFILVLMYKNGDQSKKDQIAKLYLANTKYVNNWDLVDSSAGYILGPWLDSVPPSKTSHTEYDLSGRLNGQNRRFPSSVSSHRRPLRLADSARNNDDFDRLYGSQADLSQYKMKVLTKLANSKLLWERRIAMLATSYYIGKGSANEAMQIIEILKHDSHDLIQKAVGWMLREIGKRTSREELLKFLDQNAATLPRTCLRYAIEKLSPAERQHYLKLKTGL